MRIILYFTYNIPYFQMHVHEDCKLSMPCKRTAYDVGHYYEKNIRFLSAEKCEMRHYSFAGLFSVSKRNEK